MALYFVRSRLMRVVVLLSGGIDSATALYLTRQEPVEIFTMNMVYEEGYDSEAEASKRLADAGGVKKHFSIYLPFFKHIEGLYHPPKSQVVSSAYVPARNIVFYGVAAAYAETLAAERIVFGSNADDAKELPDASQTFIQAVNDLIRIGTRTGIEGGSIRIVNPLIGHSKVEVLKWAVRLGVPLEMTWSCYENRKTPCGKCRGCLTRSKAFREAGLEDPLERDSKYERTDVLGNLDGEPRNP
jgi:7-cyano-7-deazaguanine synthase